MSASITVFFSPVVVAVASSVRAPSTTGRPTGACRRPSRQPVGPARRTRSAGKTATVVVVVAADVGAASAVASASSWSAPAAAGSACVCPPAGPPGCSSWPGSAGSSRPRPSPSPSSSGGSGASTSWARAASCPCLGRVGPGDDTTRQKPNHFHKRRK